jgi:hypothetical protein
VTIEFHAGIVVGRIPPCWPAQSVRRSKEVTVRRRFWESDEQAARLATDRNDNAPTGETYPERAPHL